MLARCSPSPKLSGSSQRPREIQETTAVPPPGRLTHHPWEVIGAKNGWTSPRTCLCPAPLHSLPGARGEAREERGPPPRAIRLWSAELTAVRMSACDKRNRPAPVNGASAGLRSWSTVKHGSTDATGWRHAIERARRALPIWMSGQPGPRCRVGRNQPPEGLVAEAQGTRDRPLAHTPSD